MNKTLVISDSAKELYNQISDSLKKHDNQRLKLVIDEMKRLNVIPSACMQNIEGNYYMMLGGDKNYSIAMQHFNSAISENPGVAIFYKNRAKLYNKLNEIKPDYVQNAISDYIKCIEINKKENKDYSELLLDLGCLYFDSGNDVKAQVLLDEAVDGFYQRDSRDGYGKTIWALIRKINDNLLRKYFYKLYYFCMKLRGRFEYHPQIPEQTLTHYTSINGLLKILDAQQREFRASNVAYMDDVREGMQVYSLFKKELREYNKLKNILGIGEDYTPNLLIQRNTYVMSFSECYDDFKMWKAYGNGGDGCAIILKNSFFDYDISFDLTEEEPDVIANDYDRNIPYFLQYTDGSKHPINGENEFNVICGVLDCILSRSSNNLDDYKGLLMAIIDRISFLYKIYDCASDREIRLVKYKDISDIEIDNYYLEHDRSPKLYMPIPIVDSVDHIILGSCVSKPNQLVQYLYKCGIKEIKLSNKYIG